MTPLQFQPTEVASWCKGIWSAVPSGITGFCHDSRQLNPGEMYIAIRGENHDGHKFIKQAADKGASAALVSSTDPLAVDGLPLLTVENTKAALQDIAASYRSRLSASVGGITGSVGKTTVKEMAADMLERQAQAARTRGNWNNDIGLPLSLLTMRPDDQYGVFETGINHPGEMALLCNILKPQWCIVTTIGPAHLEFFKDVEQIAEEKSQLAAAVPLDGFVVLSRDEEWFDFVKSCVGCRLVTVSLNESLPADYIGRLEGRRLHIQEQESGLSFACEMPLPGLFMARDALLAIAAVRQHGVAMEDALDSISHYQPLNMRWNVETIGGITFINDAYNANPLSVEAALDAFAGEPRVGRKWAVLGGMHELGAVEREAHLNMGRIFASSGIDHLLVVGPLGRMIAEGAVSAGFSSASINECSDTTEAACVLQAAVPGDRILLKASRCEHIEDVMNQFKKNTLGDI